MIALKTIPPIATIVMTASMLSSCIYEDAIPCPPASITILTEWQLAPDADPEGMAYLFYPESDDSPWRFDLRGRDGGTVGLSYGTYRMIAFNDDTSGVRFSDLDNFHEASAYTRNASLLEPLGITGTFPGSVSEKMPVRLDPDIMWTATSEHVNATERATIVCTPKQITPRIHVRFTDTVNPESAHAFSASLSGLAASIKIADSRISGNVCQPMRLTYAGQGCFQGAFYCFGISGQSHSLELYVILKDGRKMCYRYDVSDIIMESADQMNIFISVKGPELPKISGEPDTGTFDVNVDGWNIVQIYL